MSPALRSALTDIAAAIGRLDRADRRTLAALLANARLYLGDVPYIARGCDAWVEGDAIVRYLAAPVGDPVRETETGGIDAELSG